MIFPDYPPTADEFARTRREAIGDPPRLPLGERRCLVRLETCAPGIRAEARAPIVRGGCG